MRGSSFAGSLLFALIAALAAIPWMETFAPLAGWRWTTAVYSLGVALLDLEDPTKVIGVSKRALLDPVEIWEHVGQAPFVVFTTGAVVEDDGTIRIYYGGADKVMGIAEGKVDELIDSCLNENVF